MDNIRSLFKHNIYFSYIDEFDNSNSFPFAPGYRDIVGGVYKSNVIYDITTSSDLTNKIRPLVYYLPSKCLKRKENYPR